MSYEGYVQALCENGHLFSMDAYAEREYSCCPDCKGKAVFENPVDTTNGPPQGEIDWEPFKVEEEVRERCNLGHWHVVKAARYRIPTNEELEKAYKYYPED